MAVTSSGVRILSSPQRTKSKIFTLLGRQKGPLGGEASKNMLIIGSASIAQQFTNLGLVDEFHLLVHPVVLSKGKPLFKNIKDRKKLKLVNTKTFRNGVVLLQYQQDKK